MKRKLAFGAVIVICLSLFTYGSLAFFTADDTAHNVISTGSVDIELHEWADTEKTQPFPEEGADGILPGMVVTKIAEVENNGSGEVFVRVSVKKAVVLKDGEAGDPSPVTLDFNTTDWTEKDGYYYYNSILKPGETTSPLFTAVSFAKEMGNEYQNSKAAVDVAAYAVQSANNGTNVLEAKGWPEEK